MNKNKTFNWKVLKKPNLSSNINTANISYNNKYSSTIETNSNNDNISLKTKEWLSLCNKMSKNWNKFRDYDIEVLGSRSIYFNYKEEIKRMVREEEYIEEEIYKHEHNISDYDSEYNSDDEKNKHLIY